MLNKLSKLIKTNSLFGATGVLAFLSIVSGFLGLLTDRLLASRFGAGLEASIFFASFKIPDLVYNILISGGVIVAFLPIFSQYYSEDKDKAWQMVNYILNVFSFLLIVTSLALFFLSPSLVGLITPGFDQAGKEMVLLLTRLLLLQPFFLGLSNIFSGILHYFNKFLMYGLAPIFYNLGIIFGLVFLTPSFGIFGVGLGVLLGAFLHLLIQIPACFQSGFRYQFLFDFKYPAVKRVFALMGPRVFAVSVNQLNIIVLTALASTISAGSIAVFNFSNALQGFPITIIGLSLATASFPTFSRLWVEGKKGEFVKRLSLILRQTLFLIAPITILTFLLRGQIVRLVLGSGRFDWAATRLTAASLGLFALSLFASTLIPFLIRLFFSFQDTKTPTLIALLTAFLNISFSFLFKLVLSSSNFLSNLIINLLKLNGLEDVAVISLPLAISITTIIQFILFLVFLYRKVDGFNFKEISQSLKKICLASFLMMISVFFLTRFLVIFLSLETFLAVFLQTLITSFFSFLIYLLISYWLGSVELKILWSTLKNNLGNCREKNS